MSPVSKLQRAQAGSLELLERNGAARVLGTLLATRPDRSMKGVTSSAMSSIAVHAMVIGGMVWATSAGGTDAPPPPEVYTELHVNVAPPPPPPPPPVDVPESMAPVDVAKGHIVLPMPDIIPPYIPPPQYGVVIREADFTGLGAEGGRADGRENAPTLDELMAAPRMVPFTVKPELLNGPEVTNTLVRHYPPILRDAGIGGRALIWVFIDETGTVLKTQVRESSGYQALDETAERVASTMRFSPALNRDVKVQVWIEIPIVFNAR